MNKDRTCIRIVPASEDESDEIMDRLSELIKAQFVVTTAKGFSSTAVVLSYMQEPDGGIFITFGAGVAEALGKLGDALTERELFAAAGKSVAH